MSLRWTASLYSTYFIKNWFWHMWPLSPIFYFAPWWLSGEVQSVINERVISTKSFFSTWNLLSSWFFPTWIFFLLLNLIFTWSFFSTLNLFSSYFVFHLNFFWPPNCFHLTFFFPSEFWFTSIYGILNFFSPLEIFFFVILNVFHLHSGEFRETKIPNQNQKN